MWKSILKLYPDQSTIGNQLAILGKAVLFALIALVATFTAYADPASTPRPNLAVGQVWSIKSAEPTTAKIVIGRIETWNSVTAVHISVIDIPLPKGTANKLISIDHVPFNSSALALSVNRLLATDVTLPSGFEQGYQNWRRDKSANVFEVSVSEVITLLLETVVRGRA
jgi:hypothetical protein